MEIIEIDGRIFVSGIDALDVVDGTITVPEGVTDFFGIGDFNLSTDVETVVLPKTLEWASEGAFANMKVKKVDFRARNFRVKQGANIFADCTKLKELKVSSAYNSGVYDASQNTLEKVIVADGAKIYDCSFWGARNLKTLEFEDSCKNAEINLGAFEFLENIKFPRDYQDGIKFYLPEHLSSVSLSQLTVNSALNLLEYCPEVYMKYPAERCDENFIAAARKKILLGMCERHERFGYSHKSIEGEVKIMNEIKTKMENDRQKNETPQQRFMEAASQFNK